MLADPAGGRTAGDAAQVLVRKGWTLLEHARHSGDPVPELLRMMCGGVGVDILIAHRAWEVAMPEEAAIVPWQGVGIPSVRIEALAAMKLHAGGPQDLIGAGEFSLHFVRDREKSGADFLLVRGKKPLVLVEAKLSETEPAPAPASPSPATKVIQSCAKPDCMPLKCVA